MICLIRIYLVIVFCCYLEWNTFLSLYLLSDNYLMKSYCFSWFSHTWSIYWVIFCFLRVFKSFSLVFLVYTVSPENEYFLSPSLQNKNLIFSLFNVLYIGLHPRRVSWYVCSFDWYLVSDQPLSWS